MFPTCFRSVPHLPSVLQSTFSLYPYLMCAVFVELEDFRHPNFSSIRAFQSFSGINIGLLHVVGDPCAQRNLLQCLVICYLKCVDCGHSHVRPSKQSVLQLVPCQTSEYVTEACISQAVSCYPSPQNVHQEFVPCMSVYMDTEIWIVRWGKKKRMGQKSSCSNHNIKI